MRRRLPWWVGSLGGAGLLACGLAVAAGYGWLLGSETLRDKLTLFLVNVVLVVGLQVFSGNSGILSFGQMVFAGTGAYTASVLTIDPRLKPTLLTGLPGFLVRAHLSFWEATLAGAAAASVLAVLLGLPIVRLSGAAAVIAILSLLLSADVVFSAAIGITRGAGGLYAIPTGTTLDRALVVAVRAVVLARLFKDSRVGFQLRAAREDGLSAASLGVRVGRCRLASWTLAAALSGAGGAILAFWLGTISPTNFFLAPTFAVVVMLIVGGMGTVGGAVFGAASVTLVQELLRPHEDSSLDLGLVHFDRLTGLTQIALVAMILGVMYFRPDGLGGRREPDEALLSFLCRRRGACAADAQRRILRAPLDQMSNDRSSRPTTRCQPAVPDGPTAASRVE